MHFSPKRKLFYDYKKLKETEILMVDKRKFLGVIVDYKLTFLPQLKHLKNYCHKVMHVLRGLAHT